MRGVVLAAGLVFAAGCGRGAGTTAGGDATPSFGPAVGATEVHPDSVLTGYRDNPAKADAAYRGKFWRVQLGRRMERVGGETVAVFEVFESRPHHLVFHFASEAEAAKMAAPNTLYAVEGWCEGMRGVSVVFRNCRVAGEAPAPPRPAGRGKYADRK